MIIEKIDLAEFHRRLKSQGVSGREHAAVVCPICGTVQSIASLITAGATLDDAETMAGYSCEGRISNAGPWPSEPTPERRAKRGCDWTLGGLLRFHVLEVEFPDGKSHPAFAPATAEQAQALESEMAIVVL